jgi:MFS family permease
LSGTKALDAVRAARSPFVLLLAAALFINYVDRGVLPAAAPLMQGDLHLTETQLGTLLSAFFWIYAFVQVPIGLVAERYGAGRVLGAGLVLWATATILLGVTSVYPLLIALRMLLGLGESTGFPCVSKLLATAVPVESLGLANGIISFAYLFGPAVGTFLGGMLMANFGWRSAFLVFGTLSLLWLYPWSRVKVPTRTVAQNAFQPSLRRILAEPSLWGTSLGLFSSNYTFYFMLSWLPFYLVKARGYSTVEMAQLAGSAYLLTAVTALVTGWAIDRYIRRGGSTNFAYKSTMAVAHAGAVLCMLGMAFGPKPLAITSIFMYQTLLGISSPGTYAIPQILGGAAATGRWVGIQNSIGNFAGIIAPWLTGVMIEATGLFTSAFVAAAAVSLLGLIGWLWMLPNLAPLDWNR